MDLAAQRQAQAERSDAFWRRQRVQIAGRLRDHQPFSLAWRWAWASALAAAGLLGALWVRTGPLPQPARDADADQALLAAIERSIQVDVPPALRPAILLVSEVERGVAETRRGIGAPQGEQP